ncbi:PqqD family protein (plasmid) [Streptomyces sp. NBC_01343]|uniref:PqqD family protein n=1 Tax=Streptomyces sp. NBC_01343 TaxID=2903832 RepID=UPI002E0FC491|nr:PqqD family protein [Streptomyces sp. NBC_01343]
MRVRPTPGVVAASVDADGCLELHAAYAAGPAAGSGGGVAPGPGRFRCGPVGTAMWILLRRHDGDAGIAADVLAELWNTAPENARADLDIWVEEMRDAGLLCVQPAP